MGIVEIFKEAMPPYFVEKIQGVDEKQVAALPSSIKRALISGSINEFGRALRFIEIIEKLQDEKLLGEAAMERIKDLHSFEKQKA